MASIKLSPAHGVNPSIPVCFWCGNDRSEIILLGKLKNDKAAPTKAVFDLDPCDKCAEQWAKAVMIFETTHVPVRPDIMPISKDDKGEWVYPTGGMIGITVEAANRFIPGSNFKLGDKICIDTEPFQKIFSIATSNGGV